MTAVLRAERLSKRFRTRLAMRRGSGPDAPAVDEVSLELERGRTLGVVGESGSGKTTVARMLVGLTRPTAGRVLLDGTGVSELPSSVLPRRVQYVFQDPYSALNPRRTVGRSIEVPLKYLTDQDAATRRRTIRGLLDRTGLNPEVADRYPHELSGGQRQRVVVARAIAARPDVLVLDEPVSALDVSVQAQILTLLRSLQEESGITYLFISHDLAVVDTLSDDVLVMQAGTVVEEGRCGDVFTAPRHPYTHQLLAAIPDVRRPAASRGERANDADR